MATIRLDGRAIAYDTRGQGIPLVFIHQVATDRRLWQQQYASLSSQYLTVTVDILGHGAQGWPLDEISIGRAAVHVHRLLEQVVPGEAFLVGVSMGAAVAMRCALNAPSLVRGLILVSPWMRISEHTKSLIGRLFRLAESGNMTAHTDLFLRYIFPPFIWRGMSGRSSNCGLSSWNKIARQWPMPGLHAWRPGWTAIWVKFTRRVW